MDEENKESMMDDAKATSIVSKFCWFILFVSLTGLAIMAFAFTTTSENMVLFFTGWLLFCGPAAIIFVLMILSFARSL